MTENQIVQTEQAPAAIGPYSQAIVSGDLVFASGQIGLDPETGELVTDTLENEVHRALENLSAVLNAAGSSLNRVVNITLYLQNLDDFSQINQIYAGYFDTHRPARACVEVSRLPREARFEVSAIARTSN